MSDTIDKLRKAREYLVIQDGDLAKYATEEILDAILELDSRLFEVEKELRELREA